MKPVGLRKVLIVDDDHVLLEVLDQALTNSKFKVTSVDNGQDALKLFINEGFGLILTDIQMPGMNGWELAINIKKASPKTPVILMTGMGKDEVEKKMKNMHIDSVLYKPFNIHQVETTVNRYFDKYEI